MNALHRIDARRYASLSDPAWKTCRVPSDRSAGEERLWEEYGEARENARDAVKAFVDAFENWCAERTDEDWDSGAYPEGASLAVVQDNLWRLRDQRLDPGFHKLGGALEVLSSAEVQGFADEHGWEVLLADAAWRLDDYISHPGREAFGS